MGQLTTHVLDISAGLPAAGVQIELLQSTASGARLVASTRTGRDGRCAAALLAGTDFQAGRYTLSFDLADYFRQRGIALPEPPFFEQAVIQVGIADPGQHYHVPLLISPWSYSVYRGG